MNSKKYAEVEKNQCVACGACANVCPLGVITIENGCYAIINQTKCAGCGKCSTNCPAGAIILKERDVA